MFSALREMFKDPEGKALVAAAVITIAVGTVVYVLLEGWTFVDALYFSVVTLATVGFGDLHPTTDPAKLFTILYIVSGLGIMAAFLSELTKYRGAASKRRHHGDQGADADQAAAGIDPTPGSHS